MNMNEHPTSNIQHRSPTLLFVLSEADELIRIFYSSVQTAKRNALADKRPGSRPIGNPPTQAG
jgi:hypothetical protein